METFENKKYLTRNERYELAMSLNIEEGRIQKWYSNMRVKKAAEGTLCLSE